MLLKLIRVVVEVGLGSFVVVVVVVVVVVERAVGGLDWMKGKRKRLLGLFGGLLNGVGERGGLGVWRR